VNGVHHIRSCTFDVNSRSTDLITLCLSHSHKLRLQNEFHQYIHIKGQNKFMASCDIVVMMMWNVLQAADSWQLSAEIKLSLILWHCSCNTNLDVMTLQLFTVTYVMTFSVMTQMSWLLHENKSLVCLGVMYTVLSLFWYQNSVEKVNPSHLHISLFDELPAPHKHIISSKILKSKLFCCHG
jgi:hypothetical protein